VGDTDGGDGAAYTIWTLDGDAVAGFSECSGDERDSSAAPGWTNYVTVDDADHTAARAAALGGRVVEAASAVGDAGRTARVEDPQGAAFALWQPGTHVGAARVNEIGCLTMNELVTDDLDGACSFYEGLFGWTTETVDTGPDGPPIVSASNRGRLNASFGIGSEEAPYWRPVFTVASVATALGRVRDLGGSVLFGPVAIPDGGFGVALDPHGARLGLYEGDVDP
jgi:predicted enzyme related to lactoylglutathione lyase